MKVDIIGEIQANKLQATVYLSSAAVLVVPPVGGHSPPWYWVEIVYVLQLPSWLVSLIWLTPSASLIFSAPLTSSVPLAPSSCVGSYVFVSLLLMILLLQLTVFVSDCSWSSWIGSQFVAYLVCSVQVFYSFSYDAWHNLAVRHGAS